MTLSKTYWKMIWFGLIVLSAVSTICARPAGCIVQLQLQGYAVPALQLSAGNANASGQNAVITSDNGTGASVTGAPIDTPDFSSSIDFGDVTTGNGEPVIATVGLRIRTNCRYRVLMARSSFSATNLYYLGQDISGTSDGGSFITITAGPNILPTGANGDPNGSQIAAALSGTGLPLSTIAAGSASNAATSVVAGRRASLAGGISTASNAIDVPVNFACETGMDIGPGPSGAPGHFQAIVQFEIYPQQ